MIHGKSPSFSISVWRIVLAVRRLRSGTRLANARCNGVVDVVIARAGTKTATTSSTKVNPRRGGCGRRGRHRGATRRALRHALVNFAAEYQAFAAAHLNQPARLIARKTWVAVDPAMPVSAENHPGRRLAIGLKPLQLFVAHQHPPVLPGFAARRVNARERCFLRQPFHGRKRHLTRADRRRAGSPIDPGRNRQRTRPRAPGAQTCADARRAPASTELSPHPRYPWPVPFSRGRSG